MASCHNAEATIRPTLASRYTQFSARRPRRRSVRSHRALWQRRVGPPTTPDHHQSVTQCNSTTAAANCRRSKISQMLENEKETSTVCFRRGRKRILFHSTPARLLSMTVTFWYGNKVLRCHPDIAAQSDIFWSHFNSAPIFIPARISTTSIRHTFPPVQYLLLVQFDGHSVTR